MNSDFKLESSVENQKWGERDSNPLIRSERDLQSRAARHLRGLPIGVIYFCKAGDRNRTDDSAITNRVLYQLSYAGIIFDSPDRCLC